MPIDIIPFPIEDSGTPGGGGSGSSSGSLGGLSISGSLYSTNVEINLPSGGVEKGVLLITNPSGSGKRAFLAYVILTTLHHSDSVNTRVYRSPVVTANGTSSASDPTDIGASVPAAKVLAYSEPTTSSFGTRLYTMATGKDQRTIPIDWKFGVVVEPGNSILFTGQSQTNNKNVAITLFWAEITV